MPQKSYYLFNLAAFIRYFLNHKLIQFKIGAKVSDTIRKGIIDLSPYQNNTKLLMVGNVASLSGNSICFNFSRMLFEFI